jgi:hypothetical protein
VLLSDAQKRRERILASLLQLVKPIFSDATKMESGARTCVDAHRCQSDKIMFHSSPTTAGYLHSSGMDTSIYMLVLVLIDLRGHGGSGRLQKQGSAMGLGDSGAGDNLQECGMARR